MKPLSILSLVLLALSILIPFPAVAITTGNATGTQSPVSLPTEVSTLLPTHSSTLAVPSVEIPQSIGFVPVWLVVGVILIIIALSGLLWRYFHPKYVPKDEQ